MRLLHHAVFSLTLIATVLLTGCSTPVLLAGAASVATDTSVPWAIAKHMHDKITEGDPVPCHRLNSVQRALSARCGAFEAGSLDANDVAHSGLQVCPLMVAAREPRFWPVLPELLDKGAQPEACTDAPLVALAQADACPDFSKASAAELRSLRWLAEVDARAVRHDVVRMLSCPNARRAGLDQVLVAWDDAGALNPDQLGFGVFGALHPDMLTTPFAQRLEAEGHTARAGLGGYEGTQRAGFEEALRTSQWGALDWWFARAPELARSVPPTQSNRQPWLPLARVLVPTFLADPATQREMVTYLLAHGANPRQRLPFDASRSVVAYARALNSPMVALLEAPPPAPATATQLADANATATPPGALVLAPAAASALAVK